MTFGALKEMHFCWFCRRHSSGFVSCQFYDKNNVTISGQYDSEERKQAHGEKAVEDVVKALGGEKFVSKEIYAEMSPDDKPNQKVGMIRLFK